MRIVQHKTPNADRPGKDPVEVIGLSVSNPACVLYCRTSTVQSVQVEIAQ